MALPRWFAREIYVALHAQTARFRVIKYLIFLAIGVGVHAWGGWAAVLWTFGTLTIVAFGVHFLFRWKTKAWTQSWGPYKKIPIPGDGA